MTVLKGAIEWAWLTKPNTKFDADGVWSLNILPEKDDLKAVLVTHPLLTVKKDDDGRSFITLKRKVKQRNGTQNDPPALVDSKNNPVSVILGNGSICNVVFNEYPAPKAPKGVGFQLNVIQILELVEYNASAARTERMLEELPEAPEGGYEAPTVDEVAIDDSDLAESGDEEDAMDEEVA
jgi:hypothetical protein